MGKVRPFSFKGEIEASKSLMNRALIVQSFFPNLQILGSSHCDDVVKMQQALQQLTLDPNQALDCGAAGTTLRFLLARLSREHGEFRVTGEERLLGRPHKNLIKVLGQLGCSIFQNEKFLFSIKARGWSCSEMISVSMGKSSQFVSALLLSAWNLDEPLRLNVSEEKKSYGYLQMTIDFLRQMGMEIHQNKNYIEVPAHQNIAETEYKAEPDMSSCFAISSFATLSGEAEIKNFPQTSLQPDVAFIKILKEMGVSVENKEGSLFVNQCGQLKSVRLDLSDTPDLFPVLCTLLSQAQGISEISGIEHLVYKESNRIENTKNLLESLGHSCYYEGKKFFVKGSASKSYPQDIVFDPDQDHRMAMAAAMFKQLGAHIEIKTPEVVNKSFPNFWKIVGQP